NMVMHPSFEVSKTYEVKIFGTVTEKSIKELKAGMDCEDGFLKPKSVRVLKYLNNKTWIEFKLTEGKNREIRRLCENSGLTIDKLKRVAIEGLTIADVAPGKFVTMQRHQMLKLLNLHADGTRRVDAAEYFSVKKSIKVRSKHFGEKTFSTDKKFEMYRKDKYQETMKLQKQVKIDRQNEIQEKLLNERIADKKAHVPRRSTQHTGFTGSYDAVADKTDQIITK
ncbi:MAG: 23S rRNA pseudouridine2605 synthase, partial [Thermoproteota archaeon]